MNKVKDVINKIFNSEIFVVIIGIILFFKIILFYNLTIALTETLDFYTILGTIMFIIVFCMWLSVLPNKGRIIVVIIFDFLLSMLLFMDNVYYEYSNSFTSVAQFENLRYTESIMSALPTLLRLKQIFYFVDFIIIILLFIFKVTKINKEEKYSKTYLIIKMIVVISSIAMFFLVCNSYIKKGGETSYNKDLQMREATFFGYHVFDVKKTINIKKDTKYKNKQAVLNAYNQLKEDYNDKYGDCKLENLEGILKDKNLVILQLESVQEFVVNKKINGKEITPNLNKFLSDNIEFSNMYMQSYSTTADSEHSSITSLYPMENGMAFSKYYLNTYDDIFKVFNDSNYHTSYMHGNYPYFWNRGNVYGRMNIDNLSFKEDFSDLSENINGDLSDELLFRQAVQKLSDFKSPFMSYIVSASSHTPFELSGLDDRNKISIDVGIYKDTTFGNYLEAMNYADFAFGIFIDELKKANIYDDMGILVFGDHNGLIMQNEEMMDYLKQFDNDLTEVDLKLNYTRVFCGMKIPGLKNIKIEKPINKLDIKPTLTYLCGVEDGVSIGTNMFLNKNFVCLNNERIITDKYYYDEFWYDIESGNEINLNEIDEGLKNRLNYYYDCMKRELDISNSIIVNNLLKR